MAALCHLSVGRAAPEYFYAQSNRWDYLLPGGKGGTPAHRFLANCIPGSRPGVPDVHQQYVITTTVVGADPFCDPVHFT